MWELVCIVGGRELMRAENEHYSFSFPKSIIMWDILLESNY